MREELDKLLCEKYPKMMVNRNRPMTETCMCWGFECGDGWFNILDRLMGNIQHHIDWKNQQKEKFDRSGVTCEGCGAQAETYWPKAENGGIGGWVRTECKPCEQKREEEHARRLAEWEEERRLLKEGNEQ